MSEQREATWLGGPWDGETWTVAANVHTVAVHDPTEAREFAESMLGDDPTKVAPAPRTLACPVRLRSDGRRFIEWPD